MEGGSSTREKKKMSMGDGYRASSNQESARGEKKKHDWGGRKICKKKRESMDKVGDWIGTHFRILQVTPGKAGGLLGRRFLPPSPEAI